MEIFSSIQSIIYGILVLAAVIFVHELGHYLVARALKMGVVTFSIGFGPKLIKKTIGKTEYCISAIPLGGYCALVGEYSSEIEELGFTQEEAITNRPPLHRLLLAAAGPFANILFAFVIYVGIALSVGAATVLPIVGEVADNSVASEIQLQKGDTILSIDGIEITEWIEISIAINQAGNREVELVYERNGDVYSVPFSAKETISTNMRGEEEKSYKLGIGALGKTKNSPLSFVDSIKEGFYQTDFMLRNTLYGLKSLITGAVGRDELGGPIYIAQVLGEQASVGIVPLLLFAALINVNLGLLNLLPIPMLDGGTIVFSIIEMITGRQINEKIQMRLMQVGAVLLISFMIFATFNDIARIIF